MLTSALFSPSFLFFLSAAILIGAVSFFIFVVRKQQSSGSFIKKNALDEFTVDITRAASEGRLDPVIGRDTEIARVIHILSRRTKNNVVLVGPSGVGKTAIVEDLATRIATESAPDILKNKRVLSFSVAEILAGTKYRGEFEERVKRLIVETRAMNRSVILFIDEIHTIMQTKGAEGAVNFSDILKPALARGDLQIIGATTSKEYNEYIVPDASWERRFQPVLVDEPTVAQSIKIVLGLRKKYEDFHHVTFTDKSLAAAVRLSKEYIVGRRLPDKAIDIIDEAAALVHIKSAEHKPAAGLLHGAARRVGKNNEINQPGRPLVGVDHIKEVVAEWVGIKVKDIH